MSTSKETATWAAPAKYIKKNQRSGPAIYIYMHAYMHASVQMPSTMAQSAVVAHNRLQSASSPCFDYNWNSQREESVGVEDSEIPIQTWAAHRGTKVMVGGKEVGGKLTKANFAVKTDCSVCHMIKTTVPWVRQKATGYTADGNAQMVLERTIICEECYARQSGVCA